MIDTPHDATAPADPLEAAEDAERELRGALDAAGITLPGLGVDGCVHAVSPLVLVELGRAGPDVVQEPAGGIRKGAER